MQQLNLLGAARVNRILNGLQDPRLLPAQLIWNQRIPNVPAFDEDIMARFVGTIQIADIIADDAKAVVYSTGKFQYETTKIPNLKVGVGMNQSTINQLERLSANGPAAEADLAMFTNWQTRAINSVLLGVRQRIEQLKVAMLCDGVGFTYDRFGIKLTTPTWGIYSDLKVTVGTGWDTAASATPVADILGLKLVASVRYGIDFNRVTMSTQAFRHMIATTEFQNKAKVFLPAQLTFTNMQTLNMEAMRTLAQNTLGMQIEFYDARYWTQSAAGVVTSVPFMPITNVILTDSRNDGNSDVWDFANGQVTEAIVARAVGGAGIIGQMGGNVYGPLAYAALADTNLNPPGINHWGVARGFPRKHLLQSSGVLSVGSFSDAIATTVPFPQ
jgi:hypothetical protein